MTSEEEEKGIEEEAVYNDDGDDGQAEDGFCRLRFVCVPISTTKQTRRATSNITDSQPPQQSKTDTTAGTTGRAH
jgi:hypothetical protein